MRNMTANILLSRAAKYIERNGLISGKFSGPCKHKDGKPSVCAMGALIAAKYGPKALETLEYDDTKLNNAIVKSALRKVGKVLNDESFDANSLFAWSDQRRTRTSVANTFRKAIKIK